MLFLLAHFLFLEILYLNLAFALYLKLELSNLFTDCIREKKSFFIVIFLSGMLVNENDAIELLGTGAKMGVSYKSLSSSGIPLTTEPFFKSLLVAMYRNHIHELLSRSRILLPPEEARLMMGVMDEHGVLKPGQVCSFLCNFCLDISSKCKNLFHFS